MYKTLEYYTHLATCLLINSFCLHFSLSLLSPFLSPRATQDKFSQCNSPVKLYCPQNESCIAPLNGNWQSLKQIRRSKSLLLLLKFYFSGQYIQQNKASDNNALIQSLLVYRIETRLECRYIFCCHYWIRTYNSKCYIFWIVKAIDLRFSTHHTTSFLYFKT